MSWRPEAELAELLGLSTDEVAERRLRSPYADGGRPVAAPVVMPPGLFETPWATQADSYGPATFVPLYLEALASPDPADRAWGEDALSASVNHQGSPVPDGVHVVPLLFDLLAEPALPDPGLVLRLLTQLAVGHEDWCVQRGIDVDAFPRTPLHDMVAERAGRFAELLHAEAPAVRARAAEACALVGPPEGALEPLLAMADRDVEEGVRLQARLAASVVARRLGVEVEVAEPGESLASRAVGLAARAYALGAALPAAERDQLPRVVAELEADDARPAHLTWSLPLTLRRQWTTILCRWRSRGAFCFWKPTRATSSFGPRSDSAWRWRP